MKVIAYDRSQVFCKLFCFNSEENGNGMNEIHQVLVCADATNVPRENKNSIRGL
jgi:hypothetical protein